MRGWKGRAAIVAAVVAFVCQPVAVLAQAAGRQDSGSDAQDARNDAMFATPNAATPAPLSNLYATAPDLEKQIPSPLFRANALLPFGWNSNAEQIARDGTASWEALPLGNLSWAAPLGALPLRATVTGFAELERYFQASQADFDKTGGSARLQYVDAANDQAFSPYFLFAPRWDFTPTFDNQISARQDFNLGFNKRFNFDGAFQPVPIASDTSGATVLSLGVTAFVQRRLREPATSSYAAFLIPSASYVISETWNANLALELLGRWFDPDATGAANHLFEAQPIATVEYVIPARFLGGERAAGLLGRPALDVQGSYLRVWSSVPGASYSQWQAVAALKMGWRF